MRQELKTLGTSDEDSDGVGMDMTGFMMEMPPLSILQFQQLSWDRPAHEIVEDLLRQVHNS